jgi:OFA family oxalate/formate antiporter-like MFS transporter
MAPHADEESLGAALKRGAWRPLLGGFLVQLCLGTVYAWGNTTTYVTSRLRGDGGDDGLRDDITYTTTFPTYVLGLGFQALFLPIGGACERRYGARVTAGVAGAFVALGTLLAYFAVEADSLVGLVCTAGALFGVGCGFGYVAPLQCGFKWLPHHKGIVSGVVVAGFGGGAVVFNEVCRHGRRTPPGGVAREE